MELARPTSLLWFWVFFCISFLIGSVCIFVCTLETRYNALQYNANLVITQFKCWLLLGWKLHPATVSTTGCDGWSKICRPPALCNTRWNAAAAARSTFYMYVQRSSVQEGREEWVISNVARLVATGCDVNWSAVSGVWHSTCVMHWSVHTYTCALQCIGS